MKLGTLITAGAIALMPLAASAATFVVPAAGSTSGAAGSRWQSELTLHNSGPQALTVSVRYRVGSTATGAVAYTIPARSTRSVNDIVRTAFDREGTVGALVIELADRDARRLAIASRTYNVSAAGEFGQDIPAVNIEEASIAGDVTVLAGPSSAAAYRFNFGVYAHAASTVRWSLLRAGGSVVATKDVTYAAGEHAQYNAGVATLFSAEAQDNDTVHADVVSGRAIFYGSSVNAASGDPTFVPGVRTRAEIRIQFLGIDIDEDGTIDISDADGDGVLDAPLELVTSMYPNIFRVVAAGEFGEEVTLQIVSAPADAAILINADTVQMGAPGDLKGTVGQLRIRATVDGTSEILTIPVRFR